jgi:hypothetical protein
LDITDVATVGVLEQINTTGFTVFYHNSDCAKRPAGLSWMAISEELPSFNELIPIINMYYISPYGFDPNCNRKDRAAHRHFNYITSISNHPILLLTASNLYTQGHIAAAVRIVVQESVGHF